jgi:NAD(P)-dependent dehydrogenase (short-subunit alcohol dehydrogenase family)
MGQDAYAASKAAFTHFVQIRADSIPAEKCQMVSCHPGRIFTDAAKVAGFTIDSMPWDSGTFSTISHATFQRPTDYI